MKKKCIYVLALACALLPLANSPTTAQTINCGPLHWTYPMLEQNDVWGLDIVLAATLGFGTQSYPFGGSDNFEDVMFPLVLGIVSFMDEDNEKMLVFTPAPGYDATKLISFFDGINKMRSVSDGVVIYRIDDPSFCYGLKSVLYRSYIYFIDYLPLGTSTDYDIHFIDQESLIHKNVDFMTEEERRQWDAFNPSNIVIIPKE